MTCPFWRDECREKACALWSMAHEECSLLLMGEGIKDFSFAADDANFDCGIRVHVTKEWMKDDNRVLYADAAANGNPPGKENPCGEWEANPV